MADMRTIAETDQPAVVPAIFERLRQSYETAGRVQIGSILSAVGALGGFASQQAVWKACIEPGGRNPGNFLVSFGTKTGEVFYFGEAINLFLQATDGRHLSFYSFVAGAVPDPGPRTLPDLKAIFSYVSSTIGKPAFGVLRLPEPRGIVDPPRAALTRHWGWTEDLLRQAGNPAAEWPAILGFVAGRCMKAAKGIMAPSLAATIVMEAAIFMSKMDPRAVPGATSGRTPPTNWSNRALTPATQKAVVDEARPLIPTAVPR